MDSKFDNEFSSMELSVLLKEPSRLESSIEALQHQFDESMARNYDFFIETCKNASTITDDLEQCTRNIGQLSVNLSKANSLCSDLSVIAEQALQKSSRVSSAFSHLQEISELLNVAQLMRSYKVTKVYEEALQLHQTLENFDKKYPGIPSIQSTLEDASTVKAEVAQALLDSFNDDTKLEEAMRNVGLLKSAGIYSDAEIRLGFINARRSHLHSKIERLSKSQSPAYVDNITSDYRNALFEINAHYKALFAGDDTEYDKTLHIALQQEINEYINIIRDCLEQATDEKDAREILSIAYNFGSSFGRLGFDFCPLIDAAFYTTKWAPQ